MDAVSDTPRPEPWQALSRLDWRAKASTRPSTQTQSSPWHGIAIRVLLSLALVGLPTTFAVAWLVYGAAKNNQMTFARANLAADVAVAEDRVRSSLTRTRNDTGFLASAPALGAILQPQGSGGTLNEAEWTDRLVDAFGIFMATRPDYLQIRFLSVGDDIREIARVERRPDGAFGPVRGALLSSGPDVVFDKDALSLSRGGVHVSDIELNRVSGEIERPLRPAYRVTAPVYDAGDTLRGAVAIDVDARNIFGLAARSVSADTSLLIANDGGDYLLHPDEGKAFSIEFGRRINMQGEIPQLASFIDGAGGNATDTTVDIEKRPYFVAARKVHLDPGDASRYLILAAELPVDVVTGRNNSGFYAIGVTIVMLLLLGGLVQYLVLTRAIILPLHRMQRVTRDYAHGGDTDDLAGLAARKDELGNLARSFADMTKVIAERQQALTQKSEELAQSNQELSQFAYVASHDLQEPLRMIASYLGLLSSRYRAKLDKEADEFIGFAVDGAERMKRLINDLLAYSRANNRALKLEPVNTQDLVERVVETYAEQIRQSGAEIIVDTLPDVRADEIQIDRLFSNLVNNALKYRSEMAPRIHISAKSVGRDWQFSIADNGIGIDPKFRAKVFEIFTRLHSREKYSGTGIGLASCRRVVERHGGKIWVDAAEGGGSVFRFTLPATNIR